MLQKVSSPKKTNREA